MSTIKSPVIPAVGVDAATAESNAAGTRASGELSFTATYSAYVPADPGSGADPATHVGPCVTRAQQQKVLDYIRIGVEEGASIVAQGALPDDPQLANGFYFSPTLFDGVTRDMRIAQEEIFGPVVSVITFDTEDEALAIANESEYGLSGAVFTSDMERMFRVVWGIEGLAWYWRTTITGKLSGTPFVV